MRWSGDSRPLGKRRNLIRLAGKGSAESEEEMHHPVGIPAVSSHFRCDLIDVLGHGVTLGVVLRKRVLLGCVAKGLIDGTGCKLGIPKRIGDTVCADGICGVSRVSDQHPPRPVRLAKETR